jgi:hypothetical protein
MNTTTVDKIVNAVLYEGYILYPYRPSIKNQRRWMFGAVVPRSLWQEGSSDRCMMQTECLVEGNDETCLEVEVRFLQLVNRRVASLKNIARSSQDPTNWEFAHTLEFDGQLYHAWQEAIERRVSINAQRFGDLTSAQFETSFVYPNRRDIEPIESGGEIKAVLVRERQSIQGFVRIAARPVGIDLSILTVQIENTSIPPPDLPINGDSGALLNLLSTHTILNAQHGGFVSSIDPPETCRAAAAQVNNDGAWPVLVGEQRQRTMMLCSPIILYDYPEVAAESPGDWFDSTEIDEMLDLRTRTLTTDEKRWMRSVDANARRILERTEATSLDQLSNLHGTMRGLRRIDPVNQ